MKRTISNVCLVASVWLAASALAMTQENIQGGTVSADEAKPIPVLSGGAAFVPTWEGNDPTLVSIVSPVLLVPVSHSLIFESRAEFEGDFERRNGNSGDFTGAVGK